MTEVRHMLKKMVVIGEAAVGKTSLIRRFVLDKFDDRYIATLGTKTTAKELHITMDNEVIILKLQIWDVLGLRCFSNLQKSTYKGANGAFIVLDLTRKGTLFAFMGWLLSLYEVTGEIPVVLLANKNDLKAEFGKSEIEKLVMDYSFPYYLTSAKTGENVNNAFNTLGKMMIRPWSGKRIMSMLEMSGAFDKETEPEMEPGRKLSVYEVEDIIMARFCDLLEDPDYAMAIIRKQFKRADVNFMCPTMQGLKRAVDYLIKAASDRIEPHRLEKEKKAYSDLIKMIN
ncbi:MAG: Rab family GTPase [Thermoplasmata archaeon]